MLQSNYSFFYKENNSTYFTGILTAIFLSGFAICDYLASNIYPNSTSLSWLSVVFVCMSTLSANWGVQTIPNLMSSELYSSEVRPILKSFSCGVRSLLLFCSLMVSTLNSRRLVGSTDQAYSSGFRGCVRNLVLRVQILIRDHPFKTLACLRGGGGSPWADVCRC